MADHVGPWPLENVAMKAWLLRFDAARECTSRRTREQLLEWVSQADPAHLVLISHGWNNDFEVAGQLYSSFLQRLEPMLSDGTGSIASIGIIWPSTWRPESDGPQIGAVEIGSTSRSEQEARQALLEAASTETDRQRARALLAQPRLGQEEARELAAVAARALEHTAPSPDAGEVSEQADLPAGEDLLAAVEALTAEEDSSHDFGSAAPGYSPTPAANAAGGTFLDPRNLVGVFTVCQVLAQQIGGR